MEGWLFNCLCRSNILSSLEETKCQNNAHVWPSSSKSSKNTNLRPGHMVLLETDQTVDMDHMKHIQQTFKGFLSINPTGCTEGAHLSSKPGLSLQFCSCCVQQWSVSLLLLLVLTLGIAQQLLRFSVSTQKVREVDFVKRAREKLSRPRQLLHVNQCLQKSWLWTSHGHVRCRRHTVTPLPLPKKSILNANRIFFCSINGEVAPLMCT